MRTKRFWHKIFGLGAHSVFLLALCGASYVSAGGHMGGVGTGQSPMMTPSFPSTGSTGMVAGIQTTLLHYTLPKAFS